MANEANNHQQLSSENLPVVLVHRLPAFKLLFNPSSRDRLLAHFHLLDPHDSPEPHDSFLSHHAHSIRAIITIGPTPVTPEFLDRLPRLGLVAATSAGLDHIDLPACWSRGIAVTNASLAFSEDVADCAVGLLIDVLRTISAADRFVRGRLWPVKKEYPLGFKLTVHFSLLGYIFLIWFSELTFALLSY
ncbi:hypothetical protein PTKIN_Ptkin05aG0045900 [Pterospermum kingtungense]